MEIESGEVAVEPISPKQFFRELLWKVAHDPDKWKMKRARGAYKGRTGEWPPWEWSDLAPAEPSSETENYLKSEWIRYRTSQEKENALPIVETLPHWTEPAGMTRSKSACEHSRTQVYRSNKSAHLAMRKCQACGGHIKWVGAAELLKMKKLEAA